MRQLPSFGGNPLRPLRSIWLAFVNLIDLGIAFAALYAAEGSYSFRTEGLSFVDSLYFSFGTFATVGAAEIFPKMTAGKLTVILQLIVGFTS